MFRPIAAIFRLLQFLLKEYHIYIYMCVCVCVCAYIYIYIYIYIYDIMVVWIYDGINSKK